MEGKITESVGRSGSPAVEAKKRSITFYILLSAALLVFINTFALLSPILLSCFLILFITLAVNPLVSRLRTWTGGRKIATGLVLAALVAFVALTAWAAVGPLKGSLATLSERVPEYWERLQKPLIKMEQKAVISEEKMQVEVSEEIARDAGADEAAPVEVVVIQAPEPAPPRMESESNSLRSSLVGMIQGMFGQMKGLAFNTTQMVIVLVSVFFGVTFTLMNPRPVVGTLFALVPESQHPPTLKIAKRIAEFVPRWAGAMLLSMLVIGLLFFLLMWPIFGFTDAIALGLIACLFSSIPFAGPILGLIPALLLAIGQGGSTPAWVLLAYIAVQMLEGNVIIPLVMSHSMKLHPLAVILSLLLSVAAFGFLGALIAAPLVAVAGIVHEELYRTRFLPSVTDADLDHLAGSALNEKPSQTEAENAKVGNHPIGQT